MQERTLGNDRLRVSAVGLGCMGMSQNYTPFPDRQDMIVLPESVLRTIDR